MVSGKAVVLVTGASGGIGSAICLRFAEAGYRVAAHYHTNLAGAQGVVGRIESAGGEAMCVGGDVASSLDVSRIVQTVTDRYGATDVLVNNAGWEKVHYFVDGDEEIWRKIIETNFWGPLVVSKAVLPGMIKRKSGCIVNIGSDAGRGGVSKGVVYSGCKAGIMGMTKSLARELARHNIRVNCVSPGVVSTALTAQAGEIDPGRLAKIAEAIPLRRPGLPDEIADAVLFLASDKASYITGQTLSVSGGLTMA